MQYTNNKIGKHVCSEYQTYHSDFSDLSDLHCHRCARIYSMFSWGTYLNYTYNQRNRFIEAFQRKDINAAEEVLKTSSTQDRIEDKVREVAGATIDQSSDSDT
jgi:hypothetical protein